MQIADKQVTKATSWDVVTLGETMLRLTPPGYKRIEQTQSLEVEVGGSESNTAVGLARLGMRVAWLSRLTNNPLGHLIEGTIKGYGVDTSQVVWTEQDRIGLYFLEEGKMPRGSSVVYDRANSAFSRWQAVDLPEAIFQPDKARLLHLTGITPALGASATALAQRALALARAAGWKISFDLNYRGKLWSPEAARQGCHTFAAAADVLVAPLNDVCLMYGFSPENTPQQILEQLAHTYPQATSVLTLGKEGAIGREPDGTIVMQPTFPAEEVGRVGGGDAFMAGLLYGYLVAEGNSGWLANALQWGAAVAALKYATPGDMPIIDKAMATALVNSAITTSPQATGKPHLHR